MMTNNSTHEDAEGRALIKWAKLTPVARDYLIHIRNGGSLRTVREGANFKAQGVLRGVSDYFLAYPSRPYHGLWIELKRTKSYRSKVSSEQLVWLERMQRVGYLTSICYGWWEAKELIERYLEGK